MGGWMGGCRNGWMGGRRVRATGEYRFSFLVKLKKKRKNYAVFYFAGKRKENYIFMM